MDVRKKFHKLFNSGILFLMTCMGFFCVVARVVGNCDDKGESSWSHFLVCRQLCLRSGRFSGLLHGFLAQSVGLVGDNGGFGPGVTQKNVAASLWQEAQSFPLAPKVQTQTDGKKPSKVSSCRGSVRTRQLFIGTLPCVSFTSLNQDAFMAKNADSDTLRLTGRQSKNVEEKWCEIVQLGCMSQDSHLSKSILREERKLGSNHTANSSRARGTTSNLGNQGSIARSFSKSVNFMSAIRPLPDLRRGHKRKFCIK